MAEKEKVDLFRIFHRETIKIGSRRCIEEIAYISSDKHKELFYDICNGFVNRSRKKFNKAFVNRNSKQVFEFCRLFINEMALRMNSENDNATKILSDRTIDMAVSFLENCLKNNNHKTD